MKQNDGLAFMAMFEREPMIPLVITPVSQYESTFALSNRVGWESVSEYARFCRSVCKESYDRLSTPQFVFEACKELMATT